MDALAVYDLLPQTVWSLDADANGRGLWNAFAAELEELQDVFGDIKLLRSVDDLSGIQLDRLGAIYSEPREGRTDAEYRGFIKIAIFRQNSNGSVETLSKISRLVLGEEFRGIRTMYPTIDPLDGTELLDGTGTLGGYLDSRPEDILTLDGSWYLDGSFPLSGSKHQVQCIECRYSAAVGATLEATYQRIMELAAASGCLVLFYQEP